MTIHQMHAYGYPMPLSWQDRLHSASSETELVDVVREFVAQFSPSEIVQLPEACRPSKIVDGQDVTDYAFTLVRHRCDDGVSGEHTLARLTAFFSSAASRLSELLYTPATQESGNGRQTA